MKQDVAFWKQIRGGGQFDMLEIPHSCIDGGATDGEHPFPKHTPQ
jgi:hypothetical protein